MTEERNADTAFIVSAKHHALEIDLVQEVVYGLVGGFVIGHATHQTVASIGVALRKTVAKALDLDKEKVTIVVCLDFFSFCGCLLKHGTT